MLTIRDLFNENRFPWGWKVIPIFIYLPVGILLVLFRIFILIQALTAATILWNPPAVRSFVLRFIFATLGIIIFKENEDAEDDNVKVFASNHVSVLDHLVIHLLKNTVSFNVSQLPPVFHTALNYKDLGNFHNQEFFVQKIKSAVNSDQTIDVQPEMGITSGKKGLLRFLNWPCKMKRSIQPIAIKIWRPPILEISPSALNTSWYSELFWFFFVPFTVFYVRFIPVLKLIEGETPERMTRRLEKVIASTLDIETTNFTLTDKVDYERRLAVESNAKERSFKSNTDLNLIEMALRAKEVLDDVPLRAICKDLAKTKSVDSTVANFLEGSVNYTPENESVFAEICRSAAPEPKTPINMNRPSTSSGTSARTFHKSAQERMISFQERKMKLIQSSRQRYLEKHALNVMNST